MPRDVSCQISHRWVYPVALFPRNGQNMGLLHMAKSLFSYGPSHWFFLNHTQCAKGCSMPNFRVLASILTDFFFNFVTQLLTKALSYSVSDGVRCRAVPLAKGLGHRSKLLHPMLALLLCKSFFHSFQIFFTNRL